MVFDCGARKIFKRVPTWSLIVVQRDFKRAPVRFLIVGRGEFQEDA